MAKTNKRKQLEYAVEHLKNKNLTVTEISLELGVAEAVVQGILDVPKEPKPRKKSKSQDLMIRHTTNKKTNNVSIMTESASQLNDEIKKNFGNTTSRTAKDSIFKPNG